MMRSGFSVAFSLLLLLSLAIQTASPQNVRVEVRPFRNESGNVALDALGQVLIRDLSLTVALLEGFELVVGGSGAGSRAGAAAVEIVTEISQLNDGTYIASGAVIRDGAEVVREEERFDSVFDVFDTGGEIGERILSAYTNRVLEFASLSLRPTSRPEELEILLEGQPLGIDALDLERVLAGVRVVEARLAGNDPFFRRTLELAGGDRRQLTIDVPTLSAQAFDQASRQALEGFFREVGGSARPDADGGGASSGTEDTLTAGSERELRSLLSLPEATPDDRFAPVEAAVSLHREILGGFTLPRLRNGVVTVDGEAGDWRSIPTHVETNASGNRGRIVSGRFAQDSERFYGYVEVANFDDGDGIEVSLLVPGTGGGSGEGIVNITMAGSEGSSVFLAAYKNPQRGSDNWSTAYESRGAAAFTGEAYEFSLPLRALRFAGVDSSGEGVPNRFTLDVEAGVTLEPGGGGFDYDLFGSTGRQSFTTVHNTAGN